MGVRRVWRARTCAAVFAVVGLVAVGCVPSTPGPQLPPGLVMRTEGDAGFLSLPWPNDVRKAPDGTLDLSGLPGVSVNPLDVLFGKRSATSLALQGVVNSAAGTVSAFGVNSASFLQSTVPIDQATLPDPTRSTTPSSSVMLMDLDHGGERAPALVEFRARGNTYRPDNTLIVLPYPGHPLQSATRYAVVVFDSVHGTGGVALEPAALLAELDRPWVEDDGGTAAEWAALRTQRDAVRSTVAATTTHDASAILAFSVFSTQDVHAEMAAVASAVASRPQPTISVDSTRPCAPDPQAGGTETARIEGTIDMPRFQIGKYPYLLEGGRLAIGSDGTAVVQSTAPVPVSVSVPCGAAPSSGWPAVGFIDGTGATGDIDALSHPFSMAGRVVAEIPPLYGDTTVGSLNLIEQTLVKALGFDDAGLKGLLFFNLLNPAAGRTNVLQQAANHLMLLRALRSFSIDAAAFGSTGTTSVDPNRVSASGHSQGAQTLPLVAASDPTVAGVFSSSGSGGYYHQFAHARDKRDALARLTDEPQSLDELNPLIQVAQTALEAADPANYPSAVDYLNVSGRVDGCVSIESARHFAQATGLATVETQPPASLYGTPGLDPPTLTLPVSANASGHTRVNIETPGGHFAAYSDPSIGTHFLDAIDHGTTPVITTPPATADPTPGCSGRWDEPPTRYGE